MVDQMSSQKRKKSAFCVHAFPTNSAAAIEFVHDHAVHVAVLDLRIGNECGLALLRRIKEVDARIEVIMLTAQETLDTAKQAMRQAPATTSASPSICTASARQSAAHRLRCATNTIETNAVSASNLSPSSSTNHSPARR